MRISQNPSPCVRNGLVTAGSQAALLSSREASNLPPTTSSQVVNSVLRGVLPADERRRSRSGGRRGLAGLALGAAGEPGGIVVHAAVAAARRARVTLVRDRLRTAVVRGLAGAALERARAALQEWGADLGEGEGEGG